MYAGNKSNYLHNQKSCGYVSLFLGKVTRIYFFGAREALCLLPYPQTATANSFQSYLSYPSAIANCQNNYNINTINRSNQEVRGTAEVNKVSINIGEKR